MFYFRKGVSVLAFLRFIDHFTAQLLIATLECRTTDVEDTYQTLTVMPFKVGCTTLQKYLPYEKIFAKCPLLYMFQFLDAFKELQSIQEQKLCQSFYTLVSANIFSLLLSMEQLFMLLSCIVEMFTKVIILLTVFLIPC